jgi:drug/metabolite transporter (DMT)-like permease
MAILALLVSYGGVLLVFGHEFKLSGAHAGLGAALVFGSAVSYALYLVYSAELVKRLGALRLAGWATSVACICCLLQFVLLRPLDSVLSLASQVLWLSLLNASLCTALPVLLILMAMQRIGAGLVAQIGMLGLLATIGMGVVILDEPINAWIAAGTLLVLVGVYMATRTARPRN